MSIGRFGRLVGIGINDHNSIPTYLAIFYHGQSSFATNKRDLANLAIMWSKYLASNFS